MSVFKHLNPLLLACTLLPLFGWHLHAEENQAYLFTSFRGNGDGLHLAYSLDGLEWADLNKVYLKPEVGSKLMRDPHILLGPDGWYHMVWTSGWHDLGIGYAKSKDLEHWSGQKFIPLMDKVPGTETCWAPETYWDEETGQYIIVWSSAAPLPGFEKPQHRAYYTLTKDFETFTPARLFYDPGVNNIDTTMIKVRGKYIIFYKETDDQQNKVWGAIRAAVADKPLGPYTPIATPALENQQAEGPAPVVLGDKTVLYVDYYSNHDYGVFETTDWKTWTNITGNTAVIPGQRHGSIFPVPSDLLASLRKDEQALVATAPKPILDGYTADPAIRVFGDTYYVYPTSDRPHWNTNEFAVWSSKNLVDWKKEGVFLDLHKDITWADNNAWAPDCIERNGTYYFYFCGRGKIGVATSPTPVGPFTDALGHPLLERKGGGDPVIKTNTIDPYPFIDDDGQAYIYYGNGMPCQVWPLNDDMISLKGQPTNIDLRDFREGIVVFKRKGKYYFMWSIDDARSPNYRVGWGWADSPYGPVTSPDKDFIVLQKHEPVVATAHHSVVNVPGTDRWYVAYHRHALPGGNGYKRETCLVRMEFNDDGTIKPMDPMTTPFKPGDVGEPIVNGHGLPQP